jgi:hypothetical protein
LAGSAPKLIMAGMEATSHEKKDEGQTELQEAENDPAFAGS